MPKQECGQVERPKVRQKFWFCYVDGRGTPSQKHLSALAGKTEAERLARETKNDVFLLEASEVVRYLPPTPPPDVCWQMTSNLGI